MHVNLGSLVTESHSEIPYARHYLYKFSSTLKFDFACWGACMMCLAVEQMTRNEQSHFTTSIYVD